MLGYGAVVDHTLAHIQNNPPPPTKPPRDAHLNNKEKQGNSGPTYPSTLGESIRDTCHFVTTDTDPHTDIEGTGQYTLQRRHVYRRHTLGTSKQKQDYTTEMVTIHDPMGRTVGMLHPDRTQLLYHNYQQTITRRPQLATTLQAKSFPEELAHLLQRYKQGSKVPGSKRKVNLQEPLGHPPKHLSNPPTPSPTTHSRKICQPTKLPPRHDQILELL
jgi:hypothetical protein